ncbi:hypothetical protein [Kitasatospora sp. NPDC086791]|uniref:hypothetical protein n=1 Tax=Kitasatospora sp. NPDC086791 TaxID=3155178 RepID=UPI00343DD4B2
MIKHMKIRSASRTAGRKAPRGLQRPAGTETLVTRFDGGWETFDLKRHGRSTNAEWAKVPNRRDGIRRAQHAAGAFAPERELGELWTTGFVAEVKAGLRWSLYAAKSGTYEVVGAGRCGWDGMFFWRAGVRGRRAAVRCFQHVIKRGEMVGAFATSEEESY